MSGGGQVVLVHAEPTPWNVPFIAMQLASVAISQCGTLLELVGMQHAPVPGVPPHTPDPQATLGWNTPFIEAHCGADVLWHWGTGEPGTGTQHAPVTDEPQIPGAHRVL